MSWNCLEIDWIHSLHREKILDKKARIILEEAISRGGFITGAFARKLAVANLTDRSILLSKSLPSAETLYEEVVSYLGITTGFSHQQDFSSDHRMWKSRCGDVDVFFRSANEAEDCVQKTLSRHRDIIKWHAPTLANYGQEFVCGNALIQFITRVSGSPQEVLEGFDIANAKVYFDAQGLHFTDEWLGLEEDRVLGIDCWTKPNLLWRTTKWFRKHNYENLRDGDHTKIVDAVMNLAAMSKKKELTRWGKPVSLFSVQSLGKQFFYKLPARDLLQLSLIYDGYDKMNCMKILLDKGNAARTSV